MSNLVPASYGGLGPPYSSYWYVYILECNDDTYYVGCTSDLDDRLYRHSQKQVRYTSSRLPVKLVGFHAFPDKYQAYAYEKYLKSGSGRAFAKRHLLPNKE